MLRLHHLTLLFAAVLVGLVLLAPTQVEGGLRRDRNPPNCLERTLSGHTDGVRCLAYLPDGLHFVSGSADKTVKLWDASSGALVHTFAGHDGPVLCVAVSPDGKLLASGSTDRTVRVWEIGSGKQIAQLEGHTDAVVGVAFLADGRLSSAGGDGFRLWNVKDEKLLAKSINAPRLLRTAFSADGTRAAAMDWTGLSGYWDTIRCKRLFHFGAARFVSGVGISPDGKYVYYNERGTWFRFDKDHRPSTRLPANFDAGDSIAFTPDQRLLLTDAGSLAYVYDTQTLTRKAAFSVTMGMNEVTHAVAVSKDGRHMVVGSGGSEDAHGWHPGSQNKIFVYNLARLDQPVPAGPPDGSISWDVIPARVRVESGALVPLDEYFASTYQPPITLRQAGNGFDVVWSSNEILFHRQPGILEPILKDTAANFRDLVWDGRNIWVVSNYKGLLVLDRSGKVLARAGADNGISEEQRQLTNLCVVGPGEVLVGGVGAVTPHGPGRGWVAFARLAPDGNSIAIEQVINEPQRMPAGWTPASRGQGPACAPKQIFLRTTPTGPVAWVTCDQTPQSPAPVILVDTRSHTAFLYNVPTPGPESAREATFSYVEFASLKDGRILAAYNGISLFTPGPRSVAQTPPRLLSDWRDKMGTPQVLDWQGQLYFPGTRWVKIDPNTVNVQELGSGLRVDGELVERDISYATSAHFGLCAISSLDGAFYRFSCDPAHPLKIHATKELPK